MTLSHKSIIDSVLTFGLIAWYAHLEVNNKNQLS